MAFRFFIFSSALLTLLGVYFLNNVPTSIPQPLTEAAEEGEAKKEWMLQMLADPQSGKIPFAVRSKELEFLAAFEALYPYRKTRSASWKARGPWNVGGRTRAFAIDVQNVNHLIAGGVSGGIWQSMDAGTSWEKVSAPDAHPGVVSITQDTRPGSQHIWYALSGEIYGTSASATGAFYLGDGAFRSLDNGKTWSPLKVTASGTPNSFTSSYQGGWRIATSPVDSIKACVYMAVYGGIFRSKDTGNTWTAVLGGGNDSYFTDVAVSSTGIVYAALSSDGTSAKGFFRSGDGIHFTNITPSFLKKYNRTTLTINPNNENEVYFLSELESDSSGGIVTANYEGTKEYVSLVKYNYISGDGSGTGGSWQNLSGNLPVTSPNEFDKFNVQGGYDLMVRCQPGSNTVIIGGTNLYSSTDGFQTTNNTRQIGGYGIGTKLATFVSYKNHHPDQHDLHFVPGHPEQVYSANDGGIFFTSNVNANEVAWQTKSLGYITSQLYTVTIDESKPFDQWLLGGFQDNANYITYSNNLQSKWRMTVNGDGAYNYMAPNRDFLVVSIQLGKVFKITIDEYGNLHTRRRIDPVGFDKSNYNFINNLVVDPNDNNYLYMPIGKRLARLNNLRSIKNENNDNQLATGWTISKDTIKTNSVSGSTLPSEITTIAISKSQPNLLYFGTSNKHIFKVDNANQGDMIFTKLDTLRLPANAYCSGIAIDPDSAKNILVSYSNYNSLSLFFSNDAGQSWYLVGGNLEGSANETGTSPSVRCVSILKDAQGKRHYFAGTSIGLFSTDSLILATSTATNKSVWTRESPELIGANIVNDIRVRQTDGYIVVGTHGNGIFESYYTGQPQPNTITKSTSPSVYPNPAQDKIVFTFPVETEQTYQVVIYDLMGRKIMTAANATFRYGEASIPISTRGLQSGHYIIATAGSINKNPFVTRFVIAR